MSERREEDGIRAVRIVDVRMPFWSMVIFMVKWAIASIPALLILFVLFVLLGAVLGALSPR